MSAGLLHNLNIIDFTTRLPGPMATNILSKMGAIITKVERKNHVGDPFNDPKMYAHIPCFKDWYHQFNSGKEILQIDLEEDQKQISELIKNADVVIIPDHARFLDLCSKYDSKITISLAGGEDEWKSLHDLNALAMLKTFKLHLQDSNKPPFLPIAGVCFAQYLAITTLAAVHAFNRDKQPIKETLLLKEVTENVLGSLDSPSFLKTPRQLHNGAFPCYSLYQTKDQQILCLAAVEEKYWMNFLQCFDIELEIADRFSKNPQTFEIIQNKLALYDADAIREKIYKQDICLTLAS